ncbi:MAG: extracellular solute-binding protein [Pseudomonadota bacterium]
MAYRSGLLLWGLILSLSATAEMGPWRHGISMFDNFKYGPEFLHFEYANPDAPKGGRIVLSTGLNFTSFTPFLPRGMYAPGILSPGVLYDGLFVRANDEPYTIYGNLAKEVRFEDDLSRVHIRLRENAYWHDGEPITARDVKFSFDHVLAHAASGVRAALSAIESVEILGDYELMFHFRQQVGLNINAFASPMTYVNILPEHYWRSRDLSEVTLEPPLGSGPYRIADFEQGRFILWERVENYWGRDLPVHRGRHNFQQVRYDLYRDATVAREAFLKGLLDLRVEGDPYLWRTAYDVPAHDAGWLVKQQHNAKMSAGFQSALVFNTRREKLADVRVREALMRAFDFEWTNRVVYDSFYKRADSFFDDTVLEAQGLPEGDELVLLEKFRDELPDKLFTEPFRLPRSTGEGRNREELLAAKRLFEAAGWTLQDGVMRNKAGEAFTLEFLSDSTNEKRTLLPYMNQLRRLGINSNIRLVESSQYVNRLRYFDFDALLTGVPYGFPPGIEIKAYFLSSVVNLPNSANLAGIVSPAVDAFVTAILDARTLEQLTAAARALDRTLLWGHYLIPILSPQQPRVVYWNKFGRPDIDAAYATDFPSSWWWDGDRAARIHLEN